MQLKILGVYYTHSSILAALQEHNLLRIKRMIEATPGADYIASVWQPTPLLPLEKQQKSFFKQYGHMNIALQIYRALLSKPGFNYVAFLEHDVLYHHNYLNTLAEHYQQGWDGISYQSFIGLNGKGFQKLTQQDEPMSMLSMPYDKAIELMKNKIEYYVTHGSGCIEPDDKSRMLKVKGEDNVHVNMNETKHSHHLTSHYNVYSKTETTDFHRYWGSAKQYTFFQ